MTPSPPPRFLDLPPERSRPDSSLFWVLPVPYERTTTWLKGTAGGPAAILEASGAVETYDELLQFDPSSHGIHTLPPFECQDPPEQMLERLRAHLRPLIRPDGFGIVLGGEHSISPAVVQAYCDHFPNLHVLCFDAHADLRDSYESCRFGGACVSRRLLESAPLVQLGVRSLSPDEVPVLAREGLHTIFAHQMESEEVRSGRWLDRLGPTVYITFDLDVMDPSEAPGTGTPEPGGLRWKEAGALLRKVFRAKRVVGMDLVEVRPLPAMPITEFLAARLAYRSMGLWARYARKQNA